MSRAEAKSLIEQNSGTINKYNVSKKLDYLIIGEKPTKKEKVITLKELKNKNNKSSKQRLKMFSNKVS